MMRMKILLVTVLAVLLTSVAAACGADPTPTPVPPTATPVPQATATPTPSTPAWKKEWDATLAAAQKEGQLVTFLCCGIGRNVKKEIIPYFEDKFKIKWTNSTGSSYTQAPKILAEQKAGKYSLDVWMGGLNPSLPRLIPAGALAPLKPLLFHPEVMDPAGWFEGKQHWFDHPDQKYVMGVTGNASTVGVSYNTKLVDPSTITSYYDFLKPEFKGKIIARDPRIVGSSGTTATMYMNKMLGEDFMTKLLTTTDIVITKDARQAAEQLALGKYALCFFACSREVDKLKKEGQPVEGDFPDPLKEGGSVGVGGGAIYVMTKMPHPNATKFFVNWWLSKEGQTMMQKASKEDSLRVDIPKDVVLKNRLRRPGVNYTFTGSQKDYTDQLEAALTVARNALASVGK